MNILIHLLCVLVAAAVPAAAQSTATSKPIAEVASVRFESDPLLNLHHVLYAAAWGRRPDRTRTLAGPLPAPLDASLSADERAAWDEAIEYYDKHLASRDLLFDRGMSRLKTALVAGDLQSDAVGPELRAVLESAMPVYRKHFWPEHDRANRAWIAATSERMKQIAPEVIAKLEKLYGSKWFAEPVRADVVWVGNRQGAYTTVRPPHATISIAESDWSAVEVVFHEFSHHLVLPLQDRLARALGDRIREHGVLWHVVQFYLTGAAVQEVLEARGIAYTPYLYRGLFDRAWPQYRNLIETNWKPYAQGKIGLDEAIRRTVESLK